MPPRLNKLERLLSEELETYYWIGFLLADGHISLNRLNLTNKDRVVLENFCKYLGLEESCIKSRVVNNGIYYYVSVMDIENADKIRNKFDWRDRKTYNPPIEMSLPQDKKMAIAIGFIDGDGSINFRHNKTSFHISIRCHSSWFYFLKWLYGNCNINKDGYAASYITDSEVCKSLKKFSLEFNLPILERKWDKVDLNFISKNKISRDRILAVEKYLKEGLSRKEIAKLLGVTYHAVIMIIRRNKICCI